MEFNEMVNLKFLFWIQSLETRLGKCILFCLVLSSFCSAQEFQGVIIDSLSQEPIAFCNIISSNGGNITFSNNDGEFKFDLNYAEELVCFQHLNYERKCLRIRDTLNVVISLSSKQNFIADINIQTKNYSAAQSVVRAIKKFKKNLKKETKSKALLVSKSQNEIDTERSEFFGNLQQNGTSFDFEYKQGFIDLNATDKKVTLNLDLAKFIFDYDLLSAKNRILPSSILSEKEKKIPKLYDITLREIRDTVYYVYDVIPLHTSATYFVTELWVKKPEYVIEKINLVLNKNSNLQLRSVLDDKEIKLDNLELSYAFLSKQLSGISLNIKISSKTEQFVTQTKLLPFDYNEYYELAMHDLQLRSSDLYSCFLYTPVDIDFWKRQQYKSLLEEFSSKQADESKSIISELFKVRYLKADKIKIEEVKPGAIPRDELGNTIKIMPNDLFISTLFHLEGLLYFDFNCIEDQVCFKITPMVDVERSFILDERPMVINAFHRSVELLANRAKELEKELNASSMKCQKNFKYKIQKIFNKESQNLKKILSEKDIYQYVDWTGTSGLDAFRKIR